METLLRDLRFAVRSSLRRPLFTAVAVLSLALGIGANSAIFSLLNGLLYQPLPAIEAPDELVRLYTKQRGFDFPLGLSHPDFQDFAKRSDQLFEGLAGHMPLYFGVSVRGSVPQVGWAYAVAGDYFQTLGVHPAAGRLFGAEEERVAERVVVVSHEYWTSRLGADASVIGETVQLDGESFVLAGVTPPGFIGTEALMAPEFWLPLSSYCAAKGQEQLLESRGSRLLRVTGRLLPGVSVAQADAHASTVGSALAQEYREANGDVAFHAMPDSEARIEAGLGGAMDMVAAILLTLVGLVLLIACANVANLMLARASSRRKELALRVAIGAGRLQLLRQMLTESVLLALAGGLIGTGFAFAASRWLESMPMPTSVPLRLEFSPDLTVFLYTAFISVAAGLVFGLAPAWKASRSHPIQGLRDAPTDESGSRRPRLTSGLVVAQVALSLVLLVAAGLFVKSLDRALATDVGLDMTGVAAVTVDVDMLKRSEEEGRLFFDELERRMREVPGVESVTLAAPVPLDWMADGRNFGLGRDLGEDVGDEMLVMTSWVGPDYFEAMRTKILEGRGFLPTDEAGKEAVVVVNRALADRVWPEEPAIGKTLRLGGRDGEPLTVVGVAETGKYRLLGEGPRPYAFLPLEQRYSSRVTLLVRTRNDPSQALARARAEIRALEPDLALTEAQLLEDLISGRALTPIRLMAILAGAFGLVGLVLASIGLYGVMSFSVAQRMREIGVRIALGARTSQVLAQVLGQGLRLALVGAAAGMLISLAASRVLGSFLVGVSASDPRTFVAVTAALVSVATLAALVPAVRAARIDPVKTLRAE